MKLFVTGSTGFIGSHFVKQALAAGHDVVALRRPGSRPRIELPMEPRWIDGTLDGDHAQAFAGVDALVHLAAHTPNPPYAPIEDCLYWNVYASLKLARQAAVAGVDKFLVAGSCFEYGNAAGQCGDITDATPLRPTVSYATSKAAASLAFQGFAREAKVHLKLMRIYQVYGEGEQATRLWPSLHKAALAGQDFPMTAGEQVRDFISVEEVAAQFVRALDFSASIAGMPVDLSVATGQPKTLLEFASYWWSHWNASGKLIPGAVPYRAGELMRLVPRL
jgi:nucleoside-diphosphate-sugar epimerase